MKVYKITHRDKNNPNTNPLNDRYKIEDGNPFKIKNPFILTTKEIIENIKNGDKYYVDIDDKNTIVRHDANEKYITTKSDDSVDNNLLKLPIY